VLKARLAREFPDDTEGYTKARTALIQSMMDRARDALGLPRENLR